MALYEILEDGTIRKVAGSGGSGVSIKKLWENSNPSANISTGTINLSSSDYDFLIFEVASASYNLGKRQTLIAKKGESLQPTFMDNEGYYNTSGDSIFRTYRNITYNNDTTYNIGQTQARNWLSQNSAVNRTGFNDCVIPLFVFGVKL